MARTIPANLLTELQQPFNETAILVEILTTTPIYVTNAQTDLVYNSNTYTAKDLVGFDYPTESLTLKTKKLKVMLSGVNTNNTANLLASDNKTVNVYLAEINDGIVGTVLLLSSGSIKNTSQAKQQNVTGKSTNVITAIYSNELYEWKQLRGDPFSHAFQQATYSDNTLEFTETEYAYRKSWQVTHRTGFLGLRSKTDTYPAPTTTQTIDEGVFLPTLYGRVLTDSTLIYKKWIEDVSDGSKSQIVGVYAYAQGEVGGIDSVMVDGKKLYQNDGALYPIADGRLLDTIQPESLGAVGGFTSTYLEGFTGSDWIPAGTRTFKNIAAGILTFNKYKHEVFVNKGIDLDTEIQFIVNGKAVLNLATSTTEYSANPAWIIHDYLISTGGFAIPTAQIDTASFISAGALYDTIQTNGEKFAELNVIVDNTKKVGENLKDMLLSVFSDVVYANGKYKLIVDVAKSSTFVFDESNVVSSVTFKENEVRYNKVEVTYLKREGIIDYIESTHFATDASYVTADGFDRYRKVNLPFITDPYQAERAAHFILEKSRLNSMVSFDASLAAYAVSVGDVVSFTFADKGWNSKLFIVQSMAFQEQKIKFTLIEYDASIYSLTQGVIPAAPPVIPRAEDISAPINLAVTTSQLTNRSAEIGSTTIAVFTWGMISGEYIASKFSVQYKKSSDTTWIDDDDVFEKTALIPVSPGNRYDFRVYAQAGSYGTPWTTFSNKDIPLYEARIDETVIPIVSGLRVDDGLLVDDDVFEFKGNNLKLVWNSVSSVVQDLDDDIPADQNIPDYDFDGYKICFFDGTTELFCAYPADNLYNLNFDQITKLGKLRTFTIKVWVKTITNQLSSAADIITATNPQPELPTSLVITPGLRKITIDFIHPTDNDYIGMAVYISTTSGFTPNDATRVDTIAPIVPQAQIDFLPDGTQLQPETDYFVVLVPFDAYGIDNTNRTSEFFARTRQKGVNQLDGLSPWATQIDPIGEDFIRSTLEGDAIPSEFIANLTVAKLLSGIIDATVAINCQGLITSFGTGGSFAQIGLDPSDSSLFKANNGTIDTFVVSADGNATFSGNLGAATGTFSGSLIAATGTFAGDLTAVGGTFTGALSAATGSFAGSLSVGVTGYSGLVGIPTALSDVNGTEGTKLTGIATGATLNSTDAALRDVDTHTSGGTNKVYTGTEQSKLTGIDAGADVTSTKKSADAAKVQPTTANGGTPPISAGLYLFSDFMGYSNGTTWDAVIESDGKFHFGNQTNKFIEFDGTDVRLGSDTKLVGADAYANDSVYWNTYFPSVDEMSATSGGTGLAIIAPAGGLDLFGPTGSTSYIRTAKNLFGGLVSSAVPNPPTYSKNQRFKTVVEVDANFDTQQVYVSVGDLARGYGFFNNGGNTWYAFTESSNVMTIVNTSKTCQATYEFECVFTAGVNVKFYIDGVLQTTITTNLPSTT